jgi:hypothetical protein
MLKTLAYVRHHPSQLNALAERSAYRTDNVYPQHGEVNVFTWKDDGVTVMQTILISLRIASGTAAGHRPTGTY